MPNKMNIPFMPKEEFEKLRIQLREMRNQLHKRMFNTMTSLVESNAQQEEELEELKLFLDRIDCPDGETVRDRVEALHEIYKESFELLQSVKQHVSLARYGTSAFPNLSAYVTHMLKQGK